MTTPAQATDRVDGLLADEIAGRCPAPGRILDLGCGVGGTMFSLSRAFPEATLTGVTVSPVQARTGRRLALRLGLAERCRFVEGAFGLVDPGSGYDAAVAVESYAHVEDAAVLFGAAREALRPGGVLCLVDDFVAAELPSLSPEQRQRVDDVRRGWRVPGLAAPDRAVSAAAAAGFDLEAERDLTSLVRLGRPRDRVIRAVVPPLRALRLARVPFFGNMIGGDALQRGLADGSIRYRLFVFLKR